MLETYVSIPYDREPELIEIDADHLLDGMKKVIGCEVAKVVHIGKEYILVVHECGKLKKHAVNPLGTFLYYPQTTDYISGNAILARIGDRDGETDIIPLDPKDTKDSLRILQETYQKLILRKQGV